MKKKINLPKLSVAEFEIMKIIWQEKTATVSKILNEINRKREPQLNRSTIRVQASRLVDKGWLKETKVGKRLHYLATVPRGEASSMMAEDVKRRVFNGSCVELIRTLFMSSDISGSEIAEIRDLIELHQNKGE